MQEPSHVAILIESSQQKNASFLTLNPTGLDPKLSGGEGSGYAMWFLRSALLLCQCGADLTFLSAAFLDGAWRLHASSGLLSRRGCPRVVQGFV